jgi:predicted transcriptional regulator
MSEIELADRWERINSVVEEFLRGNTNVTDIAKATGLKKAEVSEYLEEWRTVVRSDKQVQIRAREALSGADQHYSMLIKEAWKVIEQADVTNQLAQKTAALKLVADIQQKQIDMLQKAGVLDNNEMAERILETEEKQQVLVQIIRDVVSSCEVCKPKVFSKLSKVTGQAEAF